MAPPDASEAERAPAEPPPLRALDVLFGIALIWPVELLGQALLGLTGAVMTRAGLSTPPGWGVPPLVAGLHYAASAAWTCAVVWLLACRLKRRSLVEGLALRPPGRWWLAWSVPLGALMAVAALAVSVLWGREDTSIAKMTSSPQGLAWVAVLATAVAPLCEEVYYRGFIFPALRHTLGPCWAGLIVTAWFAAIHVRQLGSARGLDAASLACVAGVGLVFVVIRHRTGSLLPSIVAHFVYNATQIALAAASMAAK